jgi:hypothetical protein
MGEMRKYTIEDYSGIVQKVGELLPDSCHQKGHYPYGGSDVIWGTPFSYLIIEDSLPDMLKDGRKFENLYRGVGLIPESARIEYVLCDSSRSPINSKDMTLIFKPGPDASFQLVDKYKDRKDELRGYSAIVLVEQSKTVPEFYIQNMREFLGQLGFEEKNTDEINAELIKLNEDSPNPDEKVCGALPTHVNIFMNKN